MADLDRSRLGYDGLFAGFIGYAAVAVTILLIDLLAGRPAFYTPAMLGHVLLGISFPEAEITPAAVFVYNGVHLLVFLAIGYLVALVVAEVDLHPMLWYVGFFVMIGFVFAGVVVVSMLAGPASNRLPWAAILVANLVAVVSMGFYLTRSHPQLLKKVLSGEDPDAE